MAVRWRGDILCLLGLSWQYSDVSQCLGTRNRRGLPWQGFLRFLDGTRSIKRLAIMYGMDKVVNDDVFVALATRPDLQSLEFQMAVTPELVSLAKSRRNRNCGGGQLFPQLRKLVWIGDIDGLVSFLPHLTQLTHLEATILGSHISSVETPGSLSDIATYCPKLQVLELRYTTAEDIDFELVKLSTTAEDIDISPDELVELAQRSQHLEHMEISGDHVRAPGLETVHIAKIVEALPTSEFWYWHFSAH